MPAKRYILIMFLILISGSLFAQKIRNKQFTLIDYNLNISNEFTDELAPIESYIKSIKTYNDPGNDKLRAILVHVIYYTLQEKLKEQLEIEILPVNTFLRTVKYDDYGYPEASIREAIRKGDTKFYFKVQVDIKSLTKTQKDADPALFEKYDYPVIYPEITIDITVYNNEGVIPVSKWIGTSTPQYPLPVNDYLLKGFDNKEMVILPAEDHQDDNLYLMLDRAIHNTIQNYLSQ